MSADTTTQIERLRSSNQALEHTLASLTDDQARGPSLLPNWSRGHVLSHLARSADGMLNLVTSARTRTQVPMYPSREARRAAIEDGAGRPADELRRDVHESSERLMGALAQLSGDDWDAPLTYGSRNRTGTGSVIPFLRRTEVEVHHLDLDLDYTLAHWPEDFVEALLSDIAGESSKRDDMVGCVLVGNDDEGRWVIAGGGQEISGPPPALLGWLTGRSDGMGLNAASGILPRPGAWR